MYFYIKICQRHKAFCLTLKLAFDWAMAALAALAALAVVVDHDDDLIVLAAFTVGHIVVAGLHLAGLFVSLFVLLCHLVFVFGRHLLIRVDHALRLLTFKERVVRRHFAFQHAEREFVVLQMLVASSVADSVSVVEANQFFESLGVRLEFVEFFPRQNRLLFQLENGKVELVDGQHTTRNSLFGLFGHMRLFGDHLLLVFDLLLERAALLHGGIVILLLHVCVGSKKI